MVFRISLTLKIVFGDFFHFAPLLVDDLLNRPPNMDAHLAHLSGWPFKRLLRKMQFESKRIFFCLNYLITTIIENITLKT